MYIGFVATSVSLILAAIDIGRRIPAGEVLAEPARDLNSIAYVIVAATIATIALRLRNRAGSRPETALTLAIALVSLTLLHTVSIIVVGAGFARAEIYFVIALLGAAGGIPLPRRVFDIMATAASALAIVAIAFFSGPEDSIGEVVLGSAIVALTALLAGVINAISVRQALTTIWSRKKAEDALRQRDTFLRILAHDLRGPISSLTPAVQLLRNRIGSADEEITTELIDALETTTVATNHLLESILTWGRAWSDDAQSRGTRRKGSPVPALVDSPPSGEVPRGYDFSLDHLVHQVVSELALHAKLKELDLHTEAEHTPMNGSSDELYTIIRNLVANSVKFTPSGKRVSIGCGIRNGAAELWLSDEGPGMTEGAVQRLQGESYGEERGEPRSGTKGERGHGLGLSIVGDLAASIGARLEAESGSNSGTRIRLRLG
jgi:signal transduction histidine kinase